jgi:hypothetical protein
VMDAIAGSVARTALPVKVNDEQDVRIEHSKQGRQAGSTAPIVGSAGAGARRRPRASLPRARRTHTGGGRRDHAKHWICIWFCSAWRARSACAALDDRRTNQQEPRRRRALVRAPRRSAEIEFRTTRSWSRSSRARTRSVRYYVGSIETLKPPPPAAGARRGAPATPPIRPTPAAEEAWQQALRQPDQERRSGKEPGRR